MHRAGAVLFSLLLLSPLIDAPAFGYDSVRRPVVLGLLAGLLGLSAARIARRGELHEARRDPLFLAAAIFIAVQALSLAWNGLHPEALAPMLVLCAGAAAYRCARGAPLLPYYAQTLAPWLIAGGGLVFAGVGLIQSARGLPPVATEGNVNYAGTLAAMLLPAAFAFAFIGGRPWRRLLAGGAAAALFVHLLLTHSRGGWAGASIGMIVATGALVAKGVPRARMIGGAALAVVLFVPLFFQGRYAASEGGSESADVRLEIWKSGLRMLMDCPAAGVGPGRFAVEYPPYRSGKEFALSQKYVSSGFKEVEDAHSSWVQTAVETGLPGLLAFLLVTYVAARLWRHHLKRAPSTESAAVIAGLGGGAAAYLAAGGFNALTLHASHTVLFWSFLGLMERTGAAAAVARPRLAGQGIVALRAGAAIAALFGAFGAVTLAAADGAFQTGMRRSEPEVRERLLLESVATWPGSWQAHQELSMTYAATGRFLEAAEEGKAAVRLRPHQVEALNGLAVAFLRARVDEARAEEHLRHAIAVAPYYFKSHFNLGLRAMQQGRYPEAREHLGRALECNPGHGASYYCRGVTFLIAGEGARSADDFRRARDLGYGVSEALKAEHPAAASDPRLQEFFR